MKKIICLLLLMFVFIGLSSCEEKAPQEPDFKALLREYVDEQTEVLRKQFDMDDLRIVLEEDPTIYAKNPRENEDDVGEYEYIIDYYVYAPSFIEDLLDRQAKRELDFEDIALGKQLTEAFTMDGFFVENYVLGKYSTNVCSCRGVIGDVEDTEFSFYSEPIGEYDYGTIQKRWNLQETPYEWDEIFYYNEKLNRIYYSLSEYDKNALPAPKDNMRNCKKCNQRVNATAGGYCATCVKIYKSEWYIALDGEVSID